MKRGRRATVPVGIELFDTQEENPQNPLVFVLRTEDAGRIDVNLSSWPLTALAHQSSVVFLQISSEPSALLVTLRIANGDLYEALALPVDRPISREEATQQQAVV